MPHRSENVDAKYGPSIVYVCSEKLISLIFHLTFANYEYFSGVDESVQYSIWLSVGDGIYQNGKLPPPRPTSRLSQRFQIQLNFNEWKSSSNLIANIWKLQFDYYYMIRHLLWRMRWANLNWFISDSNSI